MARLGAHTADERENKSGPQEDFRGDHKLPFVMLLSESEVSNLVSHDACEIGVGRREFKSTNRLLYFGFESDRFSIGEFRTGSKPGSKARVGLLIVGTG